MNVDLESMTNTAKAIESSADASKIRSALLQRLSDDAAMKVDTAVKVAATCQDTSV